MMKAHLLAIISMIVGVVLSLFVLCMVILMMFGMDNGCDSETDTSQFNGVGGSGGIWTQKGTPAYKNAKDTFDFWVAKGMSGAQIAGIVGNIGGAEDTGFVLDQKELSGGSGGGLYQFTPYSKYLNDAKSDKSWSVQNQGEVVLHLEPDTIAAYFRKTKNSSPEDCATDWMNMYERPSAKAREKTNGARRAAARTAYQLFGGSNISGKDSLLGEAASTAGAGEAADQQNNSCDTSGGDTASGKWGWPFKTIPKDGPTRYENGQQYGHTGMIRGGGNDFHDGYDFGSAIVGAGQPILAVHDGKVFKVANDVGWWYVWVKSSDGYNEVYQEAFNGRGDIAVNEGDEIKVGDKIGTLSGSHLHLGITKKAITSSVQSGYSDDGTWLDPIKIIKEGINN